MAAASFMAVRSTGLLLVVAGLVASDVVRRGPAAQQDGEPPYGLQLLSFSSSDDSLAAHGRFGEFMGAAFKEGAQARFKAWNVLQEKLLPALATENGRQTYDAFLKVHEASFPEYLEELRGIARGAELPFEAVFVAQIEQEFGAELKRKGANVSAPAEDHCSNYMLCSPDRCVDGHNEDNGQQNIGRTFILDATLGGVRFIAYTYMGELPSGGFGVNSNGVGFSLNWVGPPPAASPGLGRGFISRSLLDSGSMQDALARTIRTGQGGGHNTQLYDFCHRSIHNVETAHEMWAIRSIGSAPFYHANEYETLSVPGESFNPSSPHRLARVAQLPVPKSAEDILSILGDQGDQEWPIFHDAVSHAKGELSDWTLATALFDLDNRTVSILKGNPGQGEVSWIWDMSELVGASGCHASEIIILT